MAEYGADLGDFPLLQGGRRERPIFFPAEFVKIVPGQSVKAKLTMAETTEMLRFACRTPYANALTLTTSSRETLNHDDEQLQSFGVKIDKSLLAVHARVLAAPILSYIGEDGKKTRTITPQDASWNLKAVRVVKPGKPFERWTYINLLLNDRHGETAKGVVTDFASFLSRSMGVRMNSTPVLPPRSSMLKREAQGGALDEFFAWMKGQQIQLAVIILSERDSSGIYSKIKTLGDCTYGIHTSCVVAGQFGKGSLQYFANVGLKVNLKAGGVNHTLRDGPNFLKDSKTMIVGYDVTHPTNMPFSGKSADDVPSLVGLVASIDQDYAQWPSTTWENYSKQEMLDNLLVGAFSSRLELWKKHNKNTYPENIIIYRDGVSEGQFSQVVRSEIPFIRQACAAKYSGKQPKLTVIVSVKRHQTRFYPTTADEMSRSGNIKNGTVVDRGVTQARYWDFFLTAHDALQGTARPAHYTVLLDEIFRARYQDRASNELERLTHELCYLYGRASKAVSICPPAYYADIVCDRARVHRPEYFEVSDMDSVTTGSSGTANIRDREVHPALKDSMYYM